MSNDKVVLNPDLRKETDPDIGELAPKETQIFYDLEIRASSLGADIGKGVFANEDIPAGSIIVIGGGQVTSDLSKAPDDRDYAGILNEKYFITPLDFDSPTPNWFINHSCDSNTKIMGRLIIVARSDIAAGEELTIDYSTIMAGDCDFNMECKCDVSNCRKVVTNSDWKDEALFNNYFEEWAPFIQKRGIKFFEK